MNRINEHDRNLKLTIYTIVSNYYINCGQMDKLEKYEDFWDEEEIKKVKEHNKKVFRVV